MSLQNRGRQTAMGKLPIELIRTILAAVPDVRSLHSATVSCPLFYLSFLGVESSITSQVLLNQIDDTVLPEALAALDPRGMLDTPGANYNDNYFTDIFITTNFSMEPLNRVGKPITHRERCRIERAFYRFDIFCAYFHPPMATDSWGAFNDVAEHDIEWGGSHRIEYGTILRLPNLPFLMSMGLENMRKMIQANTYEERYALMRNASTDSWPPMWDTLNVPRGTWEPAPYAGYFEDETHINIERQVFVDGDSGPHDVWRWAFADNSSREWEMYCFTDIQRAWGYVLWDKDRIQASGVLNKPWEVQNTVLSPQEQDEVDLQCLCMVISQRLRRRIHIEGGSGWWDWGDESRTFECPDNPVTDHPDA
ncbi:hypothetical protein CC79DRAFT_1319236 [Sarocladium strictum]